MLNDLYVAGVVDPDFRLYRKPGRAIAYDCPSKAFTKAVSMSESCGKEPVVVKVINGRLCSEPGRLGNFALNLGQAKRDGRLVYVEGVADLERLCDILDDSVSSSELVETAKKRAEWVDYKTETRALDSREVEAEGLVRTYFEK